VASKNKIFISQLFKESMFPYDLRKKIPRLFIISTVMTLYFLAIFLNTSLDLQQAYATTFYIKVASQNSASDLKLLDVQTNPQVVAVGGKFRVNATLVNVSDGNITFSKKCESLSAVFDNPNVKVPAQFARTHFLPIEQSLVPGEKFSVSGPCSGMYEAGKQSEGKINGKITITLYDNNGKVKYLLSKNDFAFEIHRS
jgi:hypothetical protein